MNSGNEEKSELDRVIHFPPSPPDGEGEENSMEPRDLAVQADDAVHRMEATAPPLPDSAQAVLDHAHEELQRILHGDEDQ